MEKANADLEVTVDGNYQVIAIKQRGKFMSPLTTIPQSHHHRGGGVVVEGRSSHRVLCVGLNPAVQKVLRMKNMRVGDVNRVNAVTVGVGGKGQNCA